MFGAVRRILRRRKSSDRRQPSGWCLGRAFHLVMIAAVPAGAGELPAVSCVTEPMLAAGDVHTGFISTLHALPGAGVLILAEKGWFLARAADGKAVVEPVGNPDTGEV